MKNFKSLSFATILLSFIALSPFAAFSQQVPTSALPQQIEKRFGKEQKRRFDEPVIQEEKQEVGVGEDDNKVLQLNDVKFEGNTVYSSEELRALASEYIGDKVSFHDLQNISRSVTQKYRDEGYILSRAFISPQDIKNGVVTFKVTEGYIADVNLVSNVKGNTKLIKNFAEKISEKRPINKRDLERYLLLADDLPGITARSVIRPSRTTKGASELVINLEEDRAEYSVSMDNYGSRFVGPYQLTAVAAFNSLFGIFDRTTLRTITTTETDELLFYDILHEQQLFSEGTKLKVRYSNAESQPGGRLESLDIEGDTKTLEAKVEHPLIRSRKTNLSLRSGFQLLDSRTNVAAIMASNDRVRTWDNGFTLDFDDGLRSSNTISMDVVTGFDDILGATPDGTGRSRSNGEHSFNKFTADLSRLQYLFGNFSLFASANGQFTRDTLLASEEVSYGGRSYGRAYDPAEISGDKGAAGMAEIRYTSEYQGQYVQNVQYYSFYDLAGVWNDSIVGGSEPKKQTLASLGAGVRFNLMKDYTGDVSVGFPLTREVAAEGDDSKNPRIFFSLIKRF